jgi:hypothetical protein
MYIKVGYVSASLSNPEISTVSDRYSQESSFRLADQTPVCCPNIATAINKGIQKRGVSNQILIERITGIEA